MQWWVKKLYKDLPLKPIEILQEAGDMLFLPPFWKHATINAGKLVALHFNTLDNTILTLTRTIFRSPMISKRKIQERMNCEEEEGGVPFLGSK